MDKITADLLKRILAGETVDGMSLGKGQGGNVGGDAGYSIDPQMDTIYRSLPGSSGQTAWDAWNTQGDYLGQGTGDTDLTGLLKAAAIAASMYGVGSLMGSASGAAGAGTGAATGGADAATSAAWGSGAGLGGDTLTAMGMTPEWMAGAGAAGGAAGLGATGGADAATSAAWRSGAGLGKDTLTAIGAGGAAGGLGLLGDIAKIGIPLAGAVAGARPSDNGADVTKKMDPRLDAAVYGPGGLLSRAKSQFDQSPSGQNATMVQGQQMLRGLLSDPSVMQNLQSMQGAGMGLLNTPMAPNAFAGWKPRR
ncbi:MAG: hypothetical protein RJA55_2312 [Acidobacteriota bacterium]|jgi:hypothetical protein